MNYVRLMMLYKDLSNKVSKWGFDYAQPSDFLKPQINKPTDF